VTFIADRVTNVPVPFRQLRMKDAEGVLQEGVVGATDLKIVQRAAGADQSVDFSVGAAWIRIDSGTRNGLVHVYNDAVANVAATAANGTNPRVDIAVVRYNDSSIPAGTGGNTPTPEILPGTATAGAQVITPGAAGYRAGAPALPNDCMLVADILRPTATNPITTANIVDRRPWARGVHRRLVRTLGDITTTSGTPVELDGTNLKPRIECSGAPLALRLVARVGSPAAGTIVTPALDGAAIDSVTTLGYASINTELMHTFYYEVAAPAPGSHLVSWQWLSVTAAQTSTMRSSTGAPILFTVDEILRPNASND
jgi:hypothetical protein